MANIKTLKTPTLELKNPEATYLSTSAVLPDQVEPPIRNNSDHVWLKRKVVKLAARRFVTVNGAAILDREIWQLHLDQINQTQKQAAWLPD